MRFPRPILLLLSAVLALPLTSTASLAAPGPGAPAQTGDTPQQERAEETLAAVQAVFTGDGSRERQGRRQVSGGRDLTLLLTELRRLVDALDPSDQRLARSFLARPTSTDDPNVEYARGARPTSDCKVKRTKGSKVCIHWARATGHAPPKADRDRDRLPNQVERTRNVANAVWNRVVTLGGYRKPPSDRGGPNRKFDIYLANIGADNLYGYCVSEDEVSGRAYTGYCVLDDDYSRREFPANTPAQNLKVTLAHEFFHAVQFGYDAHESLWFMEGTAAWIEDEIYDSVNDNHIYLPTSPMAEPEEPLDRQDRLGVYGSWIYWRFLTERYDEEGGTGLPLLMRRLWEDADHLDSSKPRLDAIGALRNELADHRTTIPESYADFSVANRRPAAHYEEGAGYPASPPAAGHVLTAGPGVAGTEAVDHLASATVLFRPHAGLAPGSTLDLTVTDGALAASALRVVVVEPGGVVRTVPVTRTAGGWRVTVPGFDTATTREIEVTMVNGATTRSADNAVLGYTARAVAPAL